MHSGTPKCEVVTPLWRPCKDHQSYKVFYLAQFLFTVWMAGNFGCVEQRQAVLVMSSIFFMLDSVPLDKNIRVPTELCTLHQSVCMSASSSWPLSHTLHLHYLLCHFPSSSFSYALTFSSFLSLCFLFFPPSVSCLHCCLSEFAFLSFLVPSACHSWDACLSYSRFS